MHKFIKWYAPAITVGVAIFIIFFLISINSTQEYKDKEILFSTKKNKELQPVESWLSSFFKSKKQSFAYPVNEIYVKVDLNEKITNTIRYELSTISLDPYQLFCLKEELKRYKLKYFFKKSNAQIELFIYSKNKSKLTSLIKDLKKYKISAKIKEIKKEEI